MNLKKDRSIGGNDIEVSKRKENTRTEVKLTPLRVSNPMAYGSDFSLSSYGKMTKHRRNRSQIPI